MYIKRSIKFLLHKRKPGETNNLAIRMRVTLSGERPIDFPIGHNIDLEYWDTKTERAINGAINKANQSSADINRTIDEYKLAINEVFARYELLEKRKPTLGEIKDLFNDMVGRKTQFISEIRDPNADFFNIFDLFTKTVGEQNQWTPATYEKFSALRQHFKCFDPYMSFQAINDSKMQEYLAYLSKKGFRNTTIAKHLAFVRWFFRWAAHQGYYQGKIHDTFKPKLKGIDGNAKEIIYLTSDEIILLQNHQFRPNEDALERVRDVFLFCCFTGLRYSDVAKLKRSDVKNGFIKVVTQKTVDGLVIELNKYSKSILDKYKDAVFKDDKALPVISNEKMNEHLKRLGQVCGLEEPTRVVYFKGNVRHEEVYPKWALLTTHCGRRTFVVTALQLGIPSEVIIRWTGHNDYKAMKPYIKIVDELKERSMSKFDNFGKL
ncbi:integrase [Bacteroidia bacterium]|nr:integrase [Bacteroidia bacterium]